MYVYMNERGITATKGVAGLRVLTYTWSIQFLLQRFEENSENFQLDPDNLCCPQLSIEYNDEYSVDSSIDENEDCDLNTLKKSIVIRTESSKRVLSFLKSNESLKKLRIILEITQKFSCYIY